MTSCCKEPARSDRTGRVRGFTLIEMLIAITLMAMIGIAISEGLRFAERTLQGAGKVDRESWEVMAAQRFLRHALESASPAGSSGILEPTGVLRGGSGEIEFRATGPLASDGGVMSAFDIRLVHRRLDSQTQDLVVNWYPQTADLNDRGDSASEVLVSDVAAVRWGYLPAIPDSGAAQAQPGWLDDWQGRSDLPGLIRLDVTFKEGSRRVWPSLVIQLRLTHDSSCVFDVVAQDCRRT
jgi:general secretion pathway protein J